MNKRGYRVSFGLLVRRVVMKTLARAVFVILGRVKRYGN